MSPLMRLVRVEHDGRALFACTACGWDGYSDECPRAAEERAYVEPDPLCACGCGEQQRLNSRYASVRCKNRMAQRHARDKRAGVVASRFDARRASPVDLSAPALPWREKRRV